MFAGFVDVELVGEGGVGRLYKARRESTGGLVAIKELRELAGGSSALHRARRELDALLRLKGHPYVVSVEEIFEGPHGACLVMEYAPFGSLMDYLNSSEPLATPEAVLVGQHVTQALAAAHAANIIHRDVKPHNLLIGAFGQIKVCDFGIAALIRGAEGRTQTGFLTLGYASPEELDGDDEIGPPADVYSFGATMLHLITGTRPRFRGRSNMTPAGLPPDSANDPILQAIVEKLQTCLADEPEERPAIRDLAKVFDAAAAQLGDQRLQQLPLPSAPTANNTANPPDEVEPTVLRFDQLPTIHRPRPLEPPQPDTARPPRVDRPNPPGVPEGPSPPAVGPEPDTGSDRSSRLVSRRAVLTAVPVLVGASVVVAVSVRGGGGAEPPAKTSASKPANTAVPATTTTPPAQTSAPGPVVTAAPATTPAAAVTPTSPATGGLLRVGTVGDASDIIDGQHIVTKADIMRQVSGWEPLMSFSDKFVPEYTNGIAKDVTAKAADNFVITLKDGVKFSNGNAVTADDMVYSFTRMVDPNLKVWGGSVIRTVLDVGGISKVDDHTIELKLKQGVSNFKEILCSYACAIVPKDYARFDGDASTQIGTGPYMLKEFEAGKKSVHVKNPYYWDIGKPHFDEVQIIDFADAQAMTSALLANQIDCASDIPSSFVGNIIGSSNYALLNSPSGAWLTITMAVDQDPFTDQRVRQAMRLIVDRDAMVEQVLSGYGRVANDLYSPLDAAYIGDQLPPRKQDLEGARKLLAEAGKSDLTIELFAPNTTPALELMVQLFAEQAKGAGITVKPTILDSSYWGDQYLKRTFATDYWGSRNFLLQVAAGGLKDVSPYPADHWPPAGSTFEDDYKAALAETNDAKRKVITDKMQRELYDTGGLILPFFQNLLDAYNDKVQGLVERPNILNLDHYGRGFKNLYISS